MVCPVGPCSSGFSFRPASQPAGDDNKSEKGILSQAYDYVTSFFEGDKLTGYWGDRPTGVGMGCGGGNITSPIDYLRETGVVVQETMIELKPSDLLGGRQIIIDIDVTSQDLNEVIVLDPQVDEAELYLELGSNSPEMFARVDKDAANNEVCIANLVNIKNPSAETVAYLRPQKYEIIFEDTTRNQPESCLEADAPQLGSFCQPGAAANRENADGDTEAVEAAETSQTFCQTNDTLAPNRINLTGIQTSNNLFQDAFKVSIRLYVDLSAITVDAIEQLAAEKEESNYRALVQVRLRAK